MFRKSDRIQKKEASLVAELYQALVPDYRTRIASLEKKLGYSFKHKHLAAQALTHSSLLRDAVDETLARGETKIQSNERLEFLGDAVLGLCVSGELFLTRKDDSEGRLSKIRAALVNEAMLADLAQNLGLGALLFLGRGEVLQNGSCKSSILADVLEATIGAVYLDGGLLAAKAVVLGVFGEDLCEQAEQNIELDYKSSLQELIQQRYKTTPTYNVVDTIGPAHQRDFEVAVLVDCREYGRGRGPSKKKASQAAAQVALSRLTQSEQDQTSSGDLQ